MRSGCKNTECCDTPSQPYRKLASTDFCFLCFGQGWQEPSIVMAKRAGPCQKDWQPSNGKQNVVHVKKNGRADLGACPKI